MSKTKKIYVFIHKKNYADGIYVGYTEDPYVYKRTKKLRPNLIAKVIKDEDRIALFKGKPELLASEMFINNYSDNGVMRELPVTNTEDDMYWDGLVEVLYDLEKSGKALRKLLKFTKIDKDITRPLTDDLKWFGYALDSAEFGYDAIETHLNEYVLMRDFINLLDGD